MQITFTWMGNVSQYLPYDDIKYNNKIKLEEILNTPDDSEVWLFL